MSTGSALLVGCPLGALPSSEVVSVRFTRFARGCDWEALSLSEAVPASSRFFAVTLRFGGIAMRESVDACGTRRRALANKLTGVIAIYGLLCILPRG